MKKSKKLISLVASVAIIGSMAAMPIQASAAACGDGCIMYSTFSSFAHCSSCPSCGSQNYRIKGYRSCSNWPSSENGGHNDVDYAVKKCTDCGRVYKGLTYLHKVTRFPWED